MFKIKTMYKIIQHPTAILKTRLKEKNPPEKHRSSNSRQKLLKQAIKLLLRFGWHQKRI